MKGRFGGKAIKSSIFDMAKSECGKNDGDGVTRNKVLETKSLVLNFEIALGLKKL